jgi:hypothetical protein
VVATAAVPFAASNAARCRVLSATNQSHLLLISGAPGAPVRIGGIVVAANAGETLEPKSKTARVLCT